MHRNILLTLFFLALSLALIQILTSITGSSSGVTDSVAINDVDMNDQAEIVEPGIQPGIRIVQLTENSVQMSGLVAQTLVAARYTPEIKTSGKVADIQSLINYRSQHREASAQWAIARAALASSRSNFNLQKQLHHDDVISSRKLQQAKTQWLTDKARFEAREFHLADIRAATLHQWGEEIYRWIATDSTGKLSELVNRKRILLQIVLSPGQSLGQETTFIFVSPGQNRIKATKAYAVSPAPAVDPITQGTTYYFRSQDPRLKSGMRVTAWIPQGDTALSGFYLPESAVIWHQGTPWVYIERQKQRFERRKIARFHDLGDAWFIENGKFPSNDKIVTEGGQMLLSEEFHYQIGDTDDDDD